MPNKFYWRPKQETSHSAGHWGDYIYKNGYDVVLYPQPKYDNLTISEQEADRRGLFPDPNQRNHRPDLVKLEGHPTHPSRGRWNGHYLFDLTDKGMLNPNYTLFGVLDNDQDPQATLTYKRSNILPEWTITPKGNFIHNPYDNLNIYLK